MSHRISNHRARGPKNHDSIPLLPRAYQPKPDLTKRVSSDARSLLQVILYGYIMQLGTLRACDLDASVAELIWHRVAGNDLGVVK